MWMEVEVGVGEVWQWWNMCLHVGEGGKSMSAVVWTWSRMVTHVEATAHLSATNTTLHELTT